MPIFRHESPPDLAPSGTPRPRRLAVLQAVAVYCLAASIGFMAVVGAFAGGTAALGTASIASDAARIADIAPAAGPSIEPSSRR
mgnify:CR=1 FL=1